MKTSRLVGVCAVLAAGFAAWWFSGASKRAGEQPKVSIQRSSHGDGSTETANQATSPEQPKLATKELAPVVEPGARFEQPANPVEVRKKLEDALRIYKETMIYPTWSRPLNGSTQHFVDWNKPIETGQPWAADESGKEPREIRTDLLLDRMYAAPGEAITARVVVTYDKTNSEPATVETVGGGVEYVEGDEWVPAVEVPLKRSGNTYIGMFTPSKIAALTQTRRRARFAVYLQEGRFQKVIGQEFQYTTTQPFEVKELVDSRIVAGSLEVDLRVHVRHLDAPILLRAVLFDRAGKEGIATYRQYHRPTKLGEQILTINFFGRVLREKGIDGPYRIQALNGHVKVPHFIPREAYWSRPDEPAMLTRPFGAAEFSDAEFDSPEKTAKIKKLEDAINDAN